MTMNCTRKLSHMDKYKNGQQIRQQVKIQQLANAQSSFVWLNYTKLCCRTRVNHLNLSAADYCCCSSFVCANVFFKSG